MSKPTPEERYYQGGQQVICDWMDAHKDDPDYIQQVEDIGKRIHHDLQDALAEEDNGSPVWGDPLWIARCRGELSRLD